MKQKSWIRTLLSFTGRCRGKLTGSVALAVCSVAAGLVPYLGAFQIIRLLMEQTLTWDRLLFWAAVCAAGYLLKILCFGSSTLLSHLSAYTILEELRLKIADRLMRAPLGVSANRTAGSVKNVFVDKVEEVEIPLAHMIPEGLSNLLLPIAIVVYLCVIDWRMALAGIVSIPLAAIPMYLTRKDYNRQYDAYAKANDHVNSVIVEYVEGIEVVKAFNQATSSYKKFSGAVKSFKDFTLAWMKSSWKSMNLAFAILPTTLLGTLPVGLALYQAGTLGPAELGLCVMLSLGMMVPLVKLSTFVNEEKNMEYAVRAADELLRLPVLPDAAAPAEVRDTGLELKRVCFSYTGQTADEVLHHIDLKLPQGSFTALVGPSGGGKSTVAKLIARFWDVTGGGIELGGVDLREIPLSQLSRLVSFVTQDNFLFDCSLKENIRLGRPDASDEEVYAAARAAQCGEFVEKLERGWDTTAGEAGRQLSGGERQRIAIARAILKNAPIVILDEATAFTDPENEDKLQQSIGALSRGKTLLVIAHRLSTIQNADQIVVLQRGAIADVGTQGELLARCPLYREMWQAHIGAQSWAVSRSNCGEAEKNA